MYNIACFYSTAKAATTDAVNNLNEQLIPKHGMFTK